MEMFEGHGQRMIQPSDAISSERQCGNRPDSKSCVLSLGGDLNPARSKRLLYTARLLVDLAGIAGDLLVEEREQAGLHLGGRCFLTENELLELFGALSLEDELRRGQRDQNSRLNSPSDRWDFGRPFVNDVALQLRHGVSEIGGPIRPLPLFKVVITHDVDWVTTFEPVAVLKAWRYWIQRRRGVWFSPIAVLRRRALERGLDRVLAIEAARGIRSWWFMLASAYGMWRHSTRYGLAWSSTRRFVARIREANGIIGLHGSYAAGERGTYSSESRHLAETTGEEVTLHRNHYLRFDPLRGWARLEEAGILIDSSLAFPSRIGFRCGLASPYHPYDLATDRVSSVTEVPLVYMERLWHLQRPDEALQALAKVLAATREVGGTVALLFHPESFAFQQNWCAFFEAVLDLCDELGAGFVTEVDAAVAPA